MSDDRLSLEELKGAWKQRLEEAERRLADARDDVRNVEAELTAESIPSPDVHYAYQRALRIEKLALERYAKVLVIFKDLVLHGTIPEEKAG